VPSLCRTQAVGPVNEPKSLLLSRGSSRRIAPLRTSTPHIMSKLKTLCTPRPSVFAQDRRATVLSLDAFLNGEINGADFFEENYFTNGISTLVDRAFRHLNGGDAGSSIFHLSQAMGGGKTHSMISLGLLARDPQLRRTVLGERDPAPNLPACRVVGFNGRNTDTPGGIWGSVASQLRRPELVAAHNQAAPGPNTWKGLLGEVPTILFLDELPPYLAYLASSQHATPGLGVVTATLANLFVAVAEMSNVCLVISDLAGTTYEAGQVALNVSLQEARKNITSEARRSAVPITPVNPNGDELYHILRKRIFSKVAPEGEVLLVADSYRDAMQEAVSMKLTSTSPQKIHAEMLDSYPFHPSFAGLLSKFKENEGFQQTRGVIRLMQMLVSHLWKTNRAENLDVIHPYDFDLNADEIASEINAINPSLNSAIANDIAHGGTAEVEQIDAANGNNDASNAAMLILIASLSTTSGSNQGLREHELVDCLQRPGRDLSTFKTNVLDKLATRAWYLHASNDGRLFFKNQQNLAAKLHSVAQALHSETVETELKQRLMEALEPSLRDCYQIATILPPPDEVHLEQDKTTLIVVRPGGNANQLPISADWQAWWDQQVFKNRVLFLSGSRDIFQRLVDCARQTRALKSIRDELVADNVAANDPQWHAVESLNDRVGLQFSAALREAFDQIVYPSLNSTLRTSGLELDFAGNKSGEATIRHTLETAQKFTTKVTEDAFRASAELRLFGGTESKVVLWSDLKRSAAVQTRWVLHKTSALDDLKADCVRRGLWREEGNYVRRGPFPPPMPEVSLREQSVDSEGTGHAFLKIEPLHATSLVYETGDADPTRLSSPVQTPTRFEASGLRYKFLAFDPEDLTRTSVVKEWTAKLRLKHQLHNRGDHYEVEFLALPRANGVVIRYTTDGSAPTSAGAATYDGPIRIREGCRVVCAAAVAQDYGIDSDLVKVSIPQQGEQERQIDLGIPACWKKTTRFDDPGAVWDFITRLEANTGVLARDIALTAESADGCQNLEYSGAVEGGFAGTALREVASKLQEIVGAGGALRLSVGSLSFPTGQGLLDWVRQSGQTFDLSYVSQ